jgi:ubiquinone/menaquinone biosynthesis C-methylase UbiE
MNRNITSRINKAIDELIPPFVRDWKMFSFPLLWIVFGKKTRQFMDFKDGFASMTDQQIVEYYQFLASAHIKRETDLNSECVRFILDNIYGSTVLDIACGRGYLIKEIVKQNPIEVTGIDFVIDLDAMSSVNATFLQGTVEDIPFPDGYFDTVICAHTLEHVRDIPRAMKELRRVCSGRLIIVLPRQRPYRYTFDLHVHFFPYKFSVMNAISNPNGTCDLISNDWVYVEKMA